MLNNAGIGGQDGPEDWRTMDDYYKVMSVNLFGLIEVSKTFLPLIKKAKGRVVNTGKLTSFRFQINVAESFYPLLFSVPGMEIKC